MKGLLFWAVWRMQNIISYFYSLHTGHTDSAIARQTNLDFVISSCRLALETEHYVRGTGREKRRRRSRGRREEKERIHFGLVKVSRQNHPSQVFRWPGIFGRSQGFRPVTQFGELLMLLNKTAVDGAVGIPFG